MTGRLPIVAMLLLAGCTRVDESPPVAPEPPEVITSAGGIEMVRIPAGRFQMGSEDGAADQSPVHEVQLDEFLMDRYETVQRDYVRLMGTNGSLFQGDDNRPAEMVSWNYAAMYCNERSRDEGLEPCYNDDTSCNFEANGYRLPSEAEWEYACRAGSDGRYGFGDDPGLLEKHAWLKDNSAKTTHPVGTKKPNAWGLYDMHGNVAEWCNDIYTENAYASHAAANPRGPAEGEKYVLRGGSWASSADACQSAYRAADTPGFADACFPRQTLGFRCVRRVSLDDDTAAAETKASTGFLFGDIYLQHKTGAGHPERPGRLTAIVERLKKKGLLEKMAAIEPVPAERRWLTAVHSAQHVDRVKSNSEQGIGFVDAPASKQSYQVAVEAVGGILATIDAVMAGKIRNAFCAVRPPGHHACKEKAMGFCLFNNVAIAARYIQQQHKLKKVLIVDWDVHHGNGTQELFYDDPTVFYFGVHRYPFYPGTGSAEEKGAGPGLGFTLNVPLPAGAGDEEFLKAIDEVLKPAALKFHPDFVLVSAGFDAHRDDPLGGMKVSADGYAEMTRTVEAIARECCQGRLVSVLEGGYGLEGLADSVEAHVGVLMATER